MDFAKLFQRVFLRCRKGDWLGRAQDTANGIEEATQERVREDDRDPLILRVPVLSVRIGPVDALTNQLVAK